MIEEIHEDGYFYYRCYSEECGALLRAHITDSAVRHTCREASMQGSVVSLPLCPACGQWRMELKADYTIMDIVKGKMLHAFVTAGRFRGYAMELRYARSFRLLNMLYEIGKIPARPLLPVLSFDAIRASELRGLPLDIVDAFWLPYALYGHAVDYEGIDQHIIALGQGITPLLPVGTAIIHEAMRQAALLGPGEEGVT